MSDAGETTAAGLIAPAVDLSDFVHDTGLLWLALQHGERHDPFVGGHGPLEA